MEETQKAEKEGRGWVAVVARGSNRVVKNRGKVDVATGKGPRGGKAGRAARSRVNGGCKRLTPAERRATPR